MIVRAVERTVFCKIVRAVDIRGQFFVRLFVLLILEDSFL